MHTPYRPFRHNNDNKSFALNSHPASKTALLYRTALYFLPILTTLLTLYILLTSWHYNLSLPFLASLKSSPSILTCGTSPRTALLHNCKFDLLSFAWQAPPCYDALLLNSFLAFKNWMFYTHPFQTNETISLEEALKGERTLYVDWEYHVTHCTFMWMQMHRAYTVGGWIDGHLDKWGHTGHCQGVALDREKAWGEVRVVAEVKYPVCRKVGGREWKAEVEGGFKMGEMGKGKKDG